MTTKINSGKAIFYVFLLATFFLSGSAAAQQADYEKAGKEYEKASKEYEKASKEYEKRDFCTGNNYSYNNRVSYAEMREMTVGAGGVLDVDGQRNGGIRVRGENRGDVLVRACVQTTGATEAEARAVGEKIRIETAGSQIRAANAPETGHYSVSYEIIVPRRADLKLKARNGGISISGVEGALEFETENGGIHLKNIAGAVKGRTTNGGVHVQLSGSGWTGDGLDLQTTNGGVHLSIPENYAARLETGTVNGGFKSDIPALNAERGGNARQRAVRLNTDLNGGGAPIRLVTTNGGVHINAAMAKNL